jgi:hypothetical protein
MTAYSLVSRSVALIAALLAPCLSARAQEQAASSPVPPTFNHDVAPLIYSNCMACHRAGEVGPFPLTNYAEVKRKARSILKAIDVGIMPPWPAASHGEFLNERLLTSAQRQTFHDWVAAGEPEGLAADLPAAPHFPEGWQSGTPDLVLTPSEDYALAAEGGDVYQCFVLPTNEDSDRWVSVAEVKPGNRRVVHHALIYIDTSGKARALAAAGSGESYASFGGIGFTAEGGLGGWAPGMTPLPLPDGVGYFLPKGADVVLQIHYHKDGKPETDRPRIGITFSRGPVDKRYRSYPLAYRAIDIPAGESDYTVKRTFPPSPANITLLSVTPHMHLLGQRIRVTVVLPDGTFHTLVDVPKWDFNWQTIYRFRTPIQVPKGSRITLEAGYDNSANNPRNPSSPPKRVRWGEQTTDEMCFAFLGYTRDGEHVASQ